MAEGDQSEIGSSIRYENFLDCVHCGLCTTACPTYVETGDENQSPRGRIYLMRAVVDGRIPLSPVVSGHLESCLDCRSCETACPSGVQYGRLIEPFRAETDHRVKSWTLRLLLRHVFPFRRRLRFALAPAHWMQKVGGIQLLQRLAQRRLLPSSIGRLVRQLPGLKSSRSLQTDYRATNNQKHRVGLFLGCVADAMERHVHEATIRVLQHNDCDVCVPSTQTCCGAIDYHSGSTDRFASAVGRNASAFRPDVDAVIVNVAGCGAMLKDTKAIANELNVTLDPQQQQFLAKVKDISEFLVDAGLKTPDFAIPLRVAYQDACHLQHAQKIQSAPRQLLKSIPELTLAEPEEAELCCGAAGTYNLTNTEMSDRLARRKCEALLAKNPDVIATANIGCRLQLKATLKEMSVAIPVLHPIELLDAAYRHSMPISLSRRPSDTR